MTSALIVPADGPLGDSALAVDDGDGARSSTRTTPGRSTSTARTRSARSTRTSCSSPARSGTRWSTTSRRGEAARSARKRANQMARALALLARGRRRPRASRCAGPPCFLDEDLFHLNDLGRRSANIFPDQHVVARAHARARASTTVSLTVPGTVATIVDGRMHGRPPGPDAEVTRSSATSARYLSEYQARLRRRIEAEKASWPRARGRRRRRARGLVGSAARPRRPHRRRRQRSRAARHRDRRSCVDFLDADGRYAGTASCVATGSASTPRSSSRASSAATRTG